MVYPIELIIWLYTTMEKKTDFLPLQNITVFKAKKLRNFPQTEFFKALQITGNICLLTEVCDLVSAHTKLQCLAKVD